MYCELSWYPVFSDRCDDARCTKSHCCSRSFWIYVLLEMWTFRSCDIQTYNNTMSLSMTYVLLKLYQKMSMILLIRTRTYYGALLSRSYSWNLRVTYYRAQHLQQWPRVLYRTLTAVRFIFCVPDVGVGGLPLYHIIIY